MRFLFILYFVFFVFWAKAQRVEGNVYGVLENEELAYCSILVKGINLSFKSEFTSDLNGRFNFNISEGSYEIQLNYLGYNTLIDTITVKEKEVKKLIYHLSEKTLTVDIDPIIRANLIPESNTLLINKDNFLKLSGSFNDPSRSVSYTHLTLPTILLV